MKKHTSRNVGKNQKVIVGLSGGVDSAVSAYLLQKAGHDVHAVFMKNFSERVSVNHVCPWKEDRLSAYRVASHLGMPIETWDFQKEYKKAVVDYIFKEYEKGRTPNPDIMCNRQVKFNAFLKRAKKEGYTYLATGHYAHIKRDKDGRAHLRKGLDSSKDQSYFLAQLAQHQLKHVLFPVGEMLKKDVRSLAKKIQLPNADRPDSQGICFIGEVEIRDFLKQKIKPKKGKIVTTDGRVVGEHDGVWYYTIGQRRGIQVGGGPALYVVDKDVKKNVLIVGTEDDAGLFRNELIASDWRWMSGERKLPLRAKAKIRYRQEDQVVTISKISKDKVRARFDKPQRAVSPGQTLAVYVKDELVGSGVIV